MKLFLIIAGVIACFIKISDQDNTFKPVPVFDCNPKKDSDVIKIQGLHINATIIVDSTPYGPWRCDYIAKHLITAKTNLNSLKFYANITGTDFAPEVNICEEGMGWKLEPPCGEMQQDYTLTIVIPGMILKNKGNLISTYGFKNGSEVVTCNRHYGYLFKSSCCN